MCLICMQQSQGFPSTARKASTAGCHSREKRALWQAELQYWVGAQCYISPPGLALSCTMYTSLRTLPYACLTQHKGGRRAVYIGISQPMGALSLMHQILFCAALV